MHLSRNKFMALSVLVACLALLPGSSFATPARSADAMLDYVIAQLPRNRIRANGTMFVRQRRGVPLQTYQFALDARWQTGQTIVEYIIQNEEGTPLEALTFTPGHADAFKYRIGETLIDAPLPDLAANIARTDISWLDLSLYFLWWRGARFAGEEVVRSLHCHIIEVDAPPHAPQGSYARVRLWISSEQGLLLQAEGFDSNGTPIRRLWVQSVRQIDEQWMISTLEVQQTHSKSRTRLQIADVNTERDPLP
jgi:hypothetical protein